MKTIFDFVTVGLFGVLVLYFVFLTDREPSRLKHFLVSAAVFAVANQVGNAGEQVLAGALVAAGVVYAVLTARAKRSGA